MPRVEFEPTIPVLQRAKMVHASDRAATVIGALKTNLVKIRWVRMGARERQATGRWTCSYDMIKIVFTPRSFRSKNNAQKSQPCTFRFPIWNRAPKMKRCYCLVLYLNSKHTVTCMARGLLSNSSVNKPQQQRLFSMRSAQRPLLCNDSVNTFQEWKTVFSVESV
jgi:hypothetical protein